MRINLYFLFFERWTLKTIISPFPLLLLYTASVLMKETWKRTQQDCLLMTCEESTHHYETFFFSSPTVTQTNWLLFSPPTFQTIKPNIVWPAGSNRRLCDVVGSLTHGPLGAICFTGPPSLLLECAAWLKCVSIKNSVDKMFDIKDLNLIRQMEFLMQRLSIFSFPVSYHELAENRCWLWLQGGGLNASSKPSFPIPGSKPHWLYLFSTFTWHLSTQSPLETWNPQK